MVIDAVYAAAGMEPTYYWDALDGEVLGWLESHTGGGEKVWFGSGSPENLALMRREGLVVPRRSGQTIYYRLADKRLIKMFRLLHDMFCQPGKS